MNIDITKDNHALIDSKDLKMLIDKGIVSSRVRVSHILVKDKIKAKEIASELEKSNDLAKEFSALAHAYSQCPSKNNGGDLGFFSRGQMVKEFEDAAFKMEVGELAKEVVTQFGVHLLYKIDQEYLLPLKEKGE